MKRMGDHMSCLQVEVSLYANCYDLVGEGTVNLYDFLDTDAFKDVIEEIRSLTDQVAIKKLKQQLPCVTVSGIFSNRTSGGLIAHSKLIGIDIDAKDNTHIHNFSSLSKELCKIPHV